MWDGYKARLTETCDTDAPNLITNVATTVATVHDSVAVSQIHDSLAGRDCLPGEHWVDAGYPSAGQVVAARREHGVDLHGPMAANTAARADGHLGQDTFTVDWVHEQVTYPNGTTSTQWHHRHSQQGLPVILASGRLPTLPPLARLRQLTHSPAPRAPPPASGRTRSRPRGADRAADRCLERAVHGPRRGRRHHLPRRPALRPAQIPLPRPGENQPPTSVHRRRHQPRPHRRPPHWHTPSPHLHQPLHSTSPRRATVDGAK